MDAPDPQKTGFVIEAWQYMTAAVAAVMAWLAKDTMKRIKDLETDSVKKDDLHAYAAAQTKEISKLRHDIRDDINPITLQMELLQLNLRDDLKRITDRQTAVVEDIAFIKGKMRAPPKH